VRIGAKPAAFDVVIARFVIAGLVPLG